MFFVHLWPAPPRLGYITICLEGYSMANLRWIEGYEVWGHLLTQALYRGLAFCFHRCDVDGAWHCSRYLKENTRSFWYHARHGWFRSVQVPWSEPCPSLLLNQTCLHHQDWSIVSKLYSLTTDTWLKSKIQDASIAIIWCRTHHFDPACCSPARA